jgi:hypothetical protein
VSRNVSRTAAVLIIVVIAVVAFTKLSGRKATDATQMQQQLPFDLRVGAPVRITDFCQAYEYRVAAPETRSMEYGKQYLVQRLSAGDWALSGADGRPLVMTVQVVRAGRGITTSSMCSTGDGRPFPGGTEVALSGSEYTIPGQARFAEVRLLWEDQPFELRKGLQVAGRFRNTAQYTEGSW